MPYEKGAKTLVQVVQSLSSARSLEEIMKHVRIAAREIAQSDGATFVLKDSGYGFYADENAIGPLWKGQRFPLRACVSGWAMLHKQAVVIPDIYKDPRVPIDAYRPTFVKSLAMTPIRLHDPIGAIGTYWKEIHHPTNEQLEMLQALADTTSVAIENVNLYKSLEKRIEDLRHANKAKNEFLATLSHELRTPLNSIVGWSDILRDSENLDLDLKEGAESIHRNALVQANVIDNLLDVSEMVSGKFHMDMGMVSLVKAVDQAVQFEREEADAKQAQISFHNKVEDAFVNGNLDRLRQAIQNLLKNAIKFSPPGKHIDVSLTRSGPNFQVEVRDQGVGVDPRFLPQIFDIFKQADSSITRAYGGLGLGLPIVRYLIEAHHGQVSVSSAGLNQGSSFRFTIPSMYV